MQLDGLKHTRTHKQKQQQLKWVDMKIAIWGAYHFSNTPMLTKMAGKNKHHDQSFSSCGANAQCEHNILVEPCNPNSNLWVLLEIKDTQTRVTCFYRTAATKKKQREAPKVVVPLSLHARGSKKQWSTSSSVAVARKCKTTNLRPNIFFRAGKTPIMVSRGSSREWGWSGYIVLIH